MAAGLNKAVHDQYTSWEKVSDANRGGFAACTLDACRAFETLLVLRSHQRKSGLPYANPGQGTPAIITSIAIPKQT